MLAPLALLALLVSPRRQAVGAAVVAVTAILLILDTEPNARYLYPALPLLFVPFAALLGWAAAHQRALARTLLAFSIACAAINVYFLPASSWYHKDFYGPFTPGQREAYMGETAPIRNVIAWFNRAHPQAAVLLTQDSYIAGLDGDVYENHWHQYNTMDQIRRAPGVQGVRALLDQWKVRYLIARKPTASNYARPLALRELLDQCTIAEYVFQRILCRPPGAGLPRRRGASGGAGADRQARHLRRFRPFHPPARRLGEGRRLRAGFRAHRHATPISRAPRSASRLKAAN